MPHNQDVQILKAFNYKTNHKIGTKNARVHTHTCVQCNKTTTCTYTHTHTLKAGQAVKAPSTNKQTNNKPMWFRITEICYGATKQRFSKHLKNVQIV